MSPEKRIDRQRNFAETGTPSSPTSLKLFPPHGLELEQIRLKFSSGRRLNREFTAANNSMIRLNDETTDKINRIKAAQEEFLRTEMDQMSHVATGAAYLKMVDELSVAGLRPEEIMSFFIQCLSINTKISTFSFQYRETNGIQNVLLDSVNTSGNITHFTESTIEHDAGEPPIWFKGNRSMWIEFITTHSLFSLYLYPELARQPMVMKGAEERSHPSSTFENALPEWFVERGGKIPDRNIVEEELLEDREASARLTAHQFKMVDQQKYLVNSVRDKYLRAAPRFEEQRRKLLNGVGNFAELVIFLGSTVGMRGYGLDLARISTTTSQDIHKAIIPEDQTRERALNKFAELREIIFSKEAIALWLERQFIDGKLMASIQDKIGQGFIDIFNSLLGSVNQPDTLSGQALANLKQSNKNAFNILNFELAPLVTLIKGENLSYLQELMIEYKGGSIEPFIWALAETISVELTGENAKKKTDLSKQAKIAVGHIEAFLGKWIKNNWKWAYQQLGTITSDPVGQNYAGVSQAAQSIVSDEPMHTDIEVLADEEVETLIEDMRLGNLKGWHLYYTFDKKIHDQSMVEIGGLTEEERERNFSDFVRSNNVSCSIKPESVIRTFEWLVTVPPEVENIRMRKEIKSETFKKIKRGAIRIFYSLDSQGKNITFFIHQKQAQGYGF